MNFIQNKLYSFLQDENVPTAVEYAVMVALIIVVSLAAITALGSKVSTTFTNTSTKISTTTTAS
ncbi:MAG: Flp family type IVb pilin [Planctomycetota bacterium]|nr:Flp family type IVb pilin [Planctomycetota bacterium]